MLQPHVTRIATMTALAISMLVASSANAKAVIGKPTDQTKVALTTFTPASSDVEPAAAPLSSPHKQSETAPVTSAVFTPDAAGSRGTVRLAGWIDNVKNWIRDRLRAAANWLRGGARSVWDWALRVAAWARDNLGANTWVEYRGSYECKVHAVFAVPVYAVCTLRGDGSVGVEVYTR